MIRLLLALAVVGVIFYMVDKQARSTQPDDPEKSGLYQTEIDKARSVEQLMQEASKRDLGDDG